ncbi:MAG: Rieske 2Fe-2S domain-containing protein [Pseudanabaenaceae cyanobacterium SKYGB_i_bin29]|nr:Rieske 2Fe-2S domain-containing protein [Pseudanabaenaceae cyanobacterium SKYG29]MDW8421216.1 Rieske 2Fe-2S domain-containing protein [Pseudanabaenaceae cyanobacterium SKYGB_i_bin29]
MIGGTNPDVFDCYEAWYPVAYERDLDKGKPQSFTLLGQPLVIWWDGQWRVFADRCPHRLASLSEGRINEEGYLECPYHGWSFNGKGDCQRIPQQPEGGAAHHSQRACAQVYAAAVKQGLLFVYGKPGIEANPVEIPVVPAITEAETDPQEWVCLDTFRDLPYDAFTLLENVLDSSHLPFTHHRSVGNRANAAPMELKILESNRAGFVGFWAEGPRKGQLGSQTTYFVAPNLMWHDLTSQQFGRTLTVVYATPIDKGRCRLFARFPFKFSTKIPRLIFRLTPLWLSHLGQNGVLEDDQIFLHHQERYLEAMGGSANVGRAFYLPTKADLFILEFHQWLHHYQVDPFPGKKLPPPLPREQLLDRYYSHTQHCASCRSALHQIERLRHLSVGLAGIGLVCVVFNWQTVGALVGLLAGASWLGLSVVRRKFYQGREIPPRNLS